MSFLAGKDQKEGKISGRSTWENDKRIRADLKKRAVALLLELEGEQEATEKKV